jgi:RluA family pseudouridine synthase
LQTPGVNDPQTDDQPAIARQSSCAAAGFEILYEVGPCLGVLKPAGVLTQAPPGIDSLEVRIKAFLKERDHKPGGVYLGVPHRIDRPVSGAMVFAKHVRAARRLAQQFEARTVRKIYWALVQGVVEPESGTWTDILYKVHGQPRSQVVDATHPGGRSAILHYRTLGRIPQGTWLEIELETGRTHQVRIQAASRGHILLGDAYYGSTIPFGPQHEDERLRLIGLHARTLTFSHPMTKEEVTLTAPVTEAWRDLRIG